MHAENRISMRRPAAIAPYYVSTLSTSNPISALYSPNNVNNLDQSSFTNLYHQIKQTYQNKKPVVASSLNSDAFPSLTKKDPESPSHNRSPYIGYELNVHSNSYKNLNQLPSLLNSNSAAKLPSQRCVSDREDPPEQQRLRKNYSVNQLHVTKRKIGEVRYITPNQFTQHREANMIVMSIDRKANLTGMRNRGKQVYNGGRFDRKLATQKVFTRYPEEEAGSLSSYGYEYDILRAEGDYSEARRSINRRNYQNKSSLLGNYSQIEFREAKINVIGGQNPSKEMDSLFMQDDLNFGTNNNSPEPKEKEEADFAEVNMSPLTEAKVIKELKINRSGPGRRQYTDARRKRLEFLLNEPTPSEKEQQQKEGFSSKRRIILRESPVRIDPTPPPVLIEESPRREVRAPRPKMIKIIKEKPPVDTKIIEMKRLKARRKLNVLLWVSFYPLLMKKDVERDVEKRKKAIYKVVVSNLEGNFWDAETYLMTGGEKYLRELVSEHKSLELFSQNKPIIDKLLDVRINFITENIKCLFEKLIERTTKEHLSLNFLRFLSCISENSGMLPEQLIFGFESKKLNTTCYNTLKSMTPQRSKMVISSFILLRVLLQRIILKPWKVFPSLRKEKVNRQNLMIIASILYYMIMAHLKKIAGVQYDNQSLMTNKTKPVQNNSPTSEIKKTYLKMKGITPDENLDEADGFLPKDHLQAFFTNRKNIYEQVKPLVEEWHDKIYELTHTTYREILKDESKSYSEKQQKTT